LNASSERKKNVLPEFGEIGDSASSAGFLAVPAPQTLLAFKVQVGPPHIAIHQGQTVLLTDPEEQIRWPSAHRLYFRDTRVINGEAWGDCPARCPRFSDQSRLCER
jgi:hypothetical protein